MARLIFGFVVQMQALVLACCGAWALTASSWGPLIGGGIGTAVTACWLVPWWLTHRESKPQRGPWTGLHGAGPAMTALCPLDHGSDKEGQR